MSHHRAASARRRRSGRTRALISLGALAVLSTGMSVKGTFAFWTDSATVNTGGFSAGTLDITVNGQLGGQANNGGSVAVASLAMSNMTPGESVAATFTIKNDGTVPLTYNLTGTGAGDLAVTNGLQYSVQIGGTASNSGSAAGANRAGTCVSGTPSSDANTTLLTSTPTTFASNRPLAANTPETICVVARLSSAAPNGLQGKSGTASFLFDGKQIGA